MNPWALLATVAAVASGALICRRRWTRRLGPNGEAIAPAFLLIAWFSALSVGLRTGSLVGAGWVAAAPLIGIAALAVARTRRIRTRRSRWTWVDRSAFVFIAFFLIAYCGNDNYCHYAVVNAHLRDNVPPCEFNDPTRALRYHAIFDAAAALVVLGTGVTPETGLDVVSILCAFAALSCLQGLSRVLFEGAWARQSARLFYLLGFGPIYLNHAGLLLAKLAGRAVPQPGSSLFHGHSAQSFVESIVRRPMGLNHVLFLFLLTVALPRLPGRSGSKGKGPHPAWWLPCAWLLPQSSEDLTGVCGLIVGWIWLRRALPTRWMIAWGLATLAALPMSGVVSAMAFPRAEVQTPRLGTDWPPSLPYWVDLDAPDAGPRDAGLALVWRGMPLASAGSARVILAEWGPLFLGGLILGLRDPRRRVLVGVVAVGFALACLVTFRGWYKADVDRFLFYGTSAGFLLVAGWVEWLERANRRGRISRGWFRALALGLVIVPTVLGPVAYGARYSLYWALGKNPRLPTAFSDARLARLRAALAMVGPRDLIRTDARSAQDLILAGFVVDAPLAPGFAVGVVDVAAMMAGKTKDGAGPVDWIFLPADSLRVQFVDPVAECEGYVLIRP